MSTETVRKISDLGEYRDSEDDIGPRLVQRQ